MAKKGLTEQAIAEYEKALAVNPAQAGPEALSLLDLLTGKLEKDKADIHDALGSALLSQGRVEDATEQYRKALKLNPNDADARYNLANALLKKGEVGEGVTQLQQAVKNGMDDAKSHNNLGAALRREGRLDDAIAQYQEALKLDPGYAPAHFNLANALLQKGEVNGAITEYLAALKLKPDNVMVQRNIAHTIWPLATSPDAAERNGSKAVEFARAANQVTSGNNPLILRGAGGGLRGRRRFSGGD